MGRTDDDEVDETRILVSGRLICVGFVTEEVDVEIISATGFGSGRMRNKN